MKNQRKYRLPAGHDILIEMERNKKFKPFGALGKHNLTNEHPHLNIGHRKSKKPVTLAKRS
jgi:hypothetical protein